MSDEVATSTYELRTIQQAVEVGTILNGHWFRGHPQCYGTLLPSVFRESLLNSMQLPPGVRDSAGVAEQHMVEGFRLKAPSIQENLPGIHEHLSWLFLMQHHGTPTRLLDWSENVLVALYFAVRDRPDDDGELWAMEATALSLAAGIPGRPAYYSMSVSYLAAQAMIREPDHIEQMFGQVFDDAGLRPLPIMPPLAFRRMVAQSSTFTIHPLPRQGNSIPELLTNEQHLVRYRIPAGSKTQLLNDLAALGINQLVLFPDLDGLSVYLRQEVLRPQCEYVAPPRWSKSGK